MSRTLKLPEQLLALGHNYVKFGRDRQALQILGKLASFGDLPAPVAHDASTSLAEIHLRRRRYQKARRHLHAALARDPENAHHHYLMARAWFEDERGDDHRACDSFARAVELDDKNAVYRCDYGLCLLALHRDDEALEQLAEAVVLSPEEVKYVRHLAMSQLDLGRPDDARRTVLAALFRRSNEPQLKRLWDEVRFHQARLSQARKTNDEREHEAGMRMVIPFPGRGKTAKRQAAPADQRIVRLDSGASVARPHFPGTLKHSQST